MLRSGNDSFVLQTKNHLLTQFAYQIRIFSVTFNYTSPARVLCDIQNRSINIGISECFRLICSDFRNFPDLFFVPRGTLPALSGKHGSPVVAQSAYSLIGKIDRNTQSCLFHKPALNGVAILHTVGIRIGDFRTELPQSVGLLIDIPDTVFPDFCRPSIGRPCIFQYPSRTVKGSHLTGLLFQCHL